MSDTLQENAPFGHAAALKLDSVARSIKVHKPLSLSRYAAGHIAQLLSSSEETRTSKPPHAEDSRRSVLFPVISRSARESSRAQTQRQPGDINIYIYILEGGMRQRLDIIPTVRADR